MVIDIEKPSLGGVTRYKDDRCRLRDRLIWFARVGVVLSFAGSDDARVLIKVRLLAML